MAYPAVNKDYMQTKYNVTKCADRRKSKAVKYIAIHYTAGTGSAKNNCIYFGGGNRNASADYFIDPDGGIYKFNGNCAGYFTWHVGDGNGKYGITNANSIGIEVVNTGNEFTQAQKDALRALVTAIMEDYGVPAKNVVRHYDASRKICPKAYCGSTAKDAKWKELHAYVTGGKAASTPASSVKSITSKVSVSLEVLKQGSEGEQVKTLQRLLNALGFNAGKADGIFGEQTKKAVTTFQKNGGLDVDGVCGKDTWGALLGV